jgi:hypothetical protein
MYSSLPFTHSTHIFNKLIWEQGGGHFFSIKFDNIKLKKKHIVPHPLSPKELNGCSLTENVMEHKIKTRQKNFFK